MKEKKRELKIHHKSRNAQVICLKCFEHYYYLLFWLFFFNQFRISLLKREFIDAVYMIYYVISGNWFWLNVKLLKSPKIFIYKIYLYGNNKWGIVCSLVNRENILINRCLFVHFFLFANRCHCVKTAVCWYKIKCMCLKRLCDNLTSS